MDDAAKIAELTGELERVKTELAAIKSGIKQHKGTTIVDGGDLFDWGWITQEQANIQTREALKKAYEEAKWHRKG